MPDKITNYFSDNNSQDFDKYITLPQCSSPCYGCDNIIGNDTISSSTTKNEVPKSINNSKKLSIGNINKLRQKYVTFVGETLRYGKYNKNPTVQHQVQANLH